MNTGPKRRRRAVRSFYSFAEYEAWRAEHEPFDAEALAMTPEERLFAAAALTPNTSGRRPPSSWYRIVLPRALPHVAWDRAKPARNGSDT